MIRQLGLKPGAEMPRGADEAGQKDGKIQGGKRKDTPKDAVGRKQSGAKDNNSKAPVPQSSRASATHIGMKSGDGAVAKKGVDNRTNNSKKPQHSNQKVNDNGPNMPSKSNNSGGKGDHKRKVSYSSLCPSYILHISFSLSYVINI
jgi:hypothetical protein